PLFLAAHRRHHLPIFVQHPFDDVGRGKLVDVERRRIDLLGRKRLPLRAHRHAIRTSGTSREYYHSHFMIDAYLDHLRVERRLAAHTLESYARDLAALAAFAAAAGRRVDSLDRQALEAFVREQRGRGLAPRSVARSVAAIRGFYRFLVLDRALDSSPADDLRPLRAWPALPTFLSIDEVDTLMGQPDAATTLGLRDRAMIELLYATGLRVSELVGVRIADLHLDEQYLTCIGKGSKERIVPIGEQASDWIRQYSAQARRVLLK